MHLVLRWMMASCVAVDDAVLCMHVVLLRWVMVCKSVCVCFACILCCWVMAGAAATALSLSLSKVSPNPLSPSSEHFRPAQKKHTHTHKILASKASCVEYPCPHKSLYTNA